MADAVLLQTWRCVNGSTQTTVVIQSASDYADLLKYKDVVVFLEVADFANAALFVQTGPSRDEALFRDMSGALVPGSPGVTVVPFRYATATQPLARFMRWRATGNAVGAWSLMFRIWLSPNGSGQVRRMDQARKALKRAHEENERRKNPQGVIPTMSGMVTMVSK